MSHVHASLLHSADDAAVAAFIDRLAAKRPRSISTTESTGFRAELLAASYVTVHDRGTDGQGESAILLRNDAFRRALPALRLSDMPIPRRGGDKVYAARADTVHDGQILTVHMPSGVEGVGGFRSTEQARVYRDAIGGLRRYVANHPEVNEIHGDWNLRADLAWVRAYFRTHFPDFDIVAPPTGTFGERPIDWALIRRGHHTYTAAAHPNPVSDHETVIFTPLEAAVRTYLEENPPRVRQFRQPRRSVVSGVIVVHTAESFPDEVGPDAGAESVARFIRDRTSFGSYHTLADSDSTLRLVPFDAEAYGDGTGSNPHAIHISAATQAAKWPDLGEDWTDACVRNMARAAAEAARWVKTERGITIPARVITREQSEARMPGFISHGARDPGRRTDPGAAFPWDKFLAYYAEEMGFTNREDDTVTPEDIDAIAEKAAAKAVEKLLATKINTETGEWTVKQILRGTYNNVVGE